MYSLIETVAWILSGRVTEEIGFHHRLHESAADPRRPSEFVVAILTEVVGGGAAAAMAEAVDVVGGLDANNWIRPDADAATISMLNTELVMDMAAVAVDVRDTEHELLNLGQPRC